MEELSLADRKAVQALLDQRREEASFINWVEKRVDKKIEKRILVIGANRIFSLRSGGKIAREAHLTELVAILSQKPNELLLGFKTFKLEIVGDYADEILHLIRSAYNASFPGVPEKDKYKLEVSPSSRLRDLPPVDLPLGGFINTYLSLVDLYADSKVRDDIIWDMENLFIPGNVKDFNLKEFEQPITFQELRALLGALQHNTHFKSLIAKNFPLDKVNFLEFSTHTFIANSQNFMNMVTSIADTLKTNTAIEELSLERDGINKEGVTAICDSLTANKMLALSTVSFSKNNLEDKGMTSVANYIGSLNKGLVKLDLSHCGAGKAGMVALCNALKKNPHMSSTLTFFDISHNKLESDGSSSLAAFLANTNGIRSLILSNTVANVEVILSAVVRGCTELKHLDLSHNKLTKKEVSVLSKLLQASTSLVDLDLSNTQIPVDCLKDVLATISSNLYLKECKVNLAENRLGVPGAKVLAGLAEKLNNVSHLDLHDNDFGDDGIAAVAEGFSYNSTIKSLNLDANFKTRGKDKGKHAMDSLIALISSDCPLESLSLAGGAKSELRADLLPFFYALGTNNSLKSLDISGHQTGNKGAAALGKALQTNETLETLKWDFNMTTAPGFYSFSIGLKRNFTLKNMPLPINDISAALKGNEMEVNDLVMKMERLILRNQSPTSQYASGGEMGSNNQFAFLSSGQREGVQKTLFKIKATGRKLPEDKKSLIVDAENQDNVMTELYTAKEGIHQQFEHELKNQMAKFVKDCNPIFGALKKQLIDQITATVRKSVKSLDESTIKRLQTNLAFGGEDLPEDEFERILVGHAHAELSMKANQAMHSIVTISSDYLYEKIQEKLQDVADEIAYDIKTEQEAKSAATTTGSAPTSAPGTPKAAPVTSPGGKQPLVLPTGLPPTTGSRLPPQKPPPKVPPAAPPASKKPTASSGPARPARASTKPGREAEGHIEALPKVESNLEHATKGRPMGAAKRKPPTRKPRPAPPSQSQM